MHKKKRDKSKKKYSRTGFISYQTTKISQLISEGNYTLAKKIIFELLQDYSTDEILLKKLARIYVLEKKYIEAEMILEQLKEENNFNRVRSIRVMAGGENCQVERATAPQWKPELLDGSLVLLVPKTGDRPLLYRLFSLLHIK